MILIELAGKLACRLTGNLQAILEAAEMKKEGQTKKVIVTGCLAQRYSHDLAGGFSAGFQYLGKFISIDLLELVAARNNTT